MKEFNEFLFELTSDIKEVNRNEIHHIEPASFVTFLRSLTDEKLNMYFEVAAKLVDQETVPTIKELELGIIFYTSIITGIECKYENKTVSMDEKGLWAISLFAFLTMERFYRQGLLSDLSGFLYEGQPSYIPTKKMLDIKENVISSMNAEQREKHNL